MTVRLPELGIKIRDVVVHEYIEYRNKKDSGKPLLSRLCALSRLFWAEFCDWSTTVS